MSIKNIKISIVTPTHNCEKVVAQTIKSVLNQTYKNFELIIVDDHSTDNTKKIIRSFNDERIIFIQNTKNKGAAYCRNLAISKATGDYVAFLDGDDLWAKDKLQRQLEFMIENNYEFTCTDYEVVDENGKAIGMKVTSPRVITKKMFRNVDYVGCLTVMYKRSICPDLSIPNTIKKRNDYALWLKLSEKANCYALFETLSYYRKSSNSISSGKKIKLLKYHAQVFAEIYGFSSFKAWMCALRNAFFNVYKRFRYHKKFAVDVEKEKRENRFLSSIVFIIINLFVIALFFTYGNNKNIVANSASIMAIYNFSKNSESVHTVVKPNSNEIIDYSAANEMCRELYTRRDKLHPYCMLADNFSLTFHGSNHATKVYSSPVYNDFEATEYLGLPLYKNNSSMKKNALYGADFAAYIPSSIADKMVSDINGVNTYDDLLSIEEPFLFKRGNYEYLMSINNIYLNNDSAYWGDRDISNPYYQVFASHNPNAIFTHSNTIFNDAKTTNVGFDVMVNYDNVKTVVNQSVSLSKGTLNFTFENEKQQVKEYNCSQSDLKTDLLDNSSIVIYLCFGILILLDLLLISAFKELKTNLLLPCFAITGLVALFLLVGEILKTAFATQVWPFATFNFLGIVLAFIFILNLFIVALTYSKDEKNFNKI